jgi:DNA-binding NarL/FixJ family response regulator
MSALLEEIGATRGVGRGTLPDGLTAREVEVLRLLALGRSNKDISLVLSISLNTVATHVRSILTKTQSANRTEAATYAIQQGLHETRRQS